MLSDKFLDDIYNLIDVTPIEKDCGILCNHACCDSEVSGENGMLLFPGEEKLFCNDDKFKLYDTEFVLRDGFVVKLLVCNGECDRKLRPISCRIFPLIAITYGNEFELALDNRGRGLCPLVLPEVCEYITDEFYEYVEEIYNILFQDEHCIELIHLLSDELKFL